MKHEVTEGEHISAIAARHGFPRFQLIWDARANAGLRNQREDAHQLLAGDHLAVPNTAPPPKYERSTGAVHTFVVNVEKLKLRFKILDLVGKPVSGASCSLVAGGRIDTSTDGEGVAVVPIPRDCVSAQLEIAGLSYTLAVGALGPIDDPSSQAARLLNLGYWYGDELELSDGAALALAIELFQKEYGLHITGDADAEFARKLHSVHDGKG